MFVGEGVARSELRGFDRRTSRRDRSVYRLRPARGVGGLLSLCEVLVSQPIRILGDWS